MYCDLPHYINTLKGMIEVEALRAVTRFILIAYIASGHFIHTATKNPFLLRMITQACRA